MKQQGTVKFYNDNKGYGFIIPSDGGDDVFFGRHSLATDVKIGLNDVVMYDMGTDRKTGKLQARNLELVDGPA